MPERFHEVPRKVSFIIMDGHPVHKAKKVKDYVQNLEGRLSLFLLPPYAPDLNPDEPVRHQTKHFGTSKKPLRKGESLTKSRNNEFAIDKGKQILDQTIL